MRSSSESRPRWFWLGFALLGVLGLVVVVIAGAVAVRLADEPTRDLSDLIGQYNVLVAVAQLTIALAIALATVFYAFKTSDLVAHSRTENDARAQREVDRAAGELVGACLGVAAASGGLQPLLRQSWRWYLPGGDARRERFALPLVAQIQSGLVACARQAEELRYLRPALSAPADCLVDTAMAAHDAAMRRDAAALEHALAQIRPAADRLRAEVGGADKATSAAPALRAGLPSRQRRDVAAAGQW